MPSSGTSTTPGGADAAGIRSEGLFSERFVCLLRRGHPLGRRRGAVGADRFVVHAPPVALPGFTMRQLWHERSDADPAHRWLRARVAETAATRRRGRPR